jgi:hypothetical protein
MSETIKKPEDIWLIHSTDFTQNTPADNAGIWDLLCECNALPELLFFIDQTNPISEINLRKIAYDFVTKTNVSNEENTDKELVTDPMLKEALKKIKLYLYSEDIEDNDRLPPIITELTLTITKETKSVALVMAVARIAENSFTVGDLIDVEFDVYNAAKLVGCDIQTIKKQHLEIIKSFGNPFSSKK